MKLPRPGFLRLKLGSFGVFVGTLVFLLFVLSAIAVSTNVMLHLSTL